jgi:hypothetical protein
MVVQPSGLLLLDIQKAAFERQNNWKRPPKRQKLKAATTIYVLELDTVLVPY